MKFRRKMAFIAPMALVSSATPFVAAMAQEQQQQQQSVSAPLVEEVVVSARKREESLSEIPVSVSAFSEAQLEAINFRSLEDVAVRTPGLQFSEQGGSIPGRYNCALRFRGMNVASEMPSYQLGSLFVDGMYVLSGCHSLGAEDIQQVEVIKGPQAAYFGRNTFGGAVNYITRAPGNDFGMKAIATIAEKSDTEYLLSAEGPLLGDALRARLSLRHYDKGPDYIATDGGELGARKTQSVGLTLASDIGPFTGRIRAFYGEDRDSAPVGGFISGNQFDSCTGTTGPNGEMRQRYICGTIPSIKQMPANFLSHNTTLSPVGFNPAMPDFLRDVYVNNRWQTTPGGAFRSDPALDDALDIDGFGLKRNSMRIGGTASYELPNDWTITGVASYNEVEAVWIRDYDLTDAEVWWSADPQDMRDMSLELRMSGETDRFDWIVGVSHYNQKFTGNGGGGTSVAMAPSINGTVIPQVFTNGLNNNDEITNLGIFGGVTYRFNDQWNISLEGRYQIDEMEKGQTASALTGIPVASAEWKTFLPRVILQWLPTDSTNLYLSYAKGVLPGDINASYVYGTDGMRSPAELQSLREQTATGSPSRPDLGIPGGTPGIANVNTYIDEEKLDSIELGWKQQWLDGRANTAIAAYWMDWTNQKGRSSAFIIDANGSTNNPYIPDDPVACQGVARPTTLPGGVVCDDVLRSVGYTIPGSSKIRGVEFEGSYSLTRALRLDLGIEWNHNEYTDYTYNLIEILAGTKNMTGNRAIRYPEWKGNFAASYEGGSVFNGRANWFARTDLMYFGEYFVDEANMAKAPSQTLLDARVGLNFDRTRVELFGRNLTGEDAWASAARWSDFTIPGVFAFSANQGVAVSPQLGRRFGVRLSYQF